MGRDQLEGMADGAIEDDQCRFDGSPNCKIYIGSLARGQKTRTDSQLVFHSATCISSLCEIQCSSAFYANAINEIKRSGGKRASFDDGL